MFKVEFKTEGAAFEEGYFGRSEISRILVGIAKKVDEDKDHGVIFDINDNRIGTWYGE